MTQQFGQGFESLEERTLLAANVAATLVGDTLYVTGDNTSNNVAIFGDGVDGHVTVNSNGQDLLVFGGNQVESNEADFTGVTNIVVLGNAGEDNIHVADIVIDGNLTVRGGLDTDFISLHSHTLDTYIGGNVLLNGGASANDAIEVETFGYGDDITIGGNLGMVNFGGYGGLLVAAEYGNINVGGSVLMNTFSGLGGYGSAEIRSDYGNVNIGGSVWMNGGAGDDFLGIFAGYGAPAYGNIKTGINIGGSVTMFGGWGDDDIQIGAYGYGYFQYGSAAYGYGGYGFVEIKNNIQVGGNVDMVGGVGFDYISVAGNGADVDIGASLRQFGGFGDDTLLAYSSGYGTVNIAANVLGDGGDGNDFIGAYGIVVGGGALVIGGNGDDGVDLDYNVINNGAWISTNLGDDIICAEGNFVGGPGVVVDGGVGGFDQAFIGGNQVLGFEVVANIEKFLDFCPFDVDESQTAPKGLKNFF
jgi:hypothetical protein